MYSLYITSCFFMWAVPAIKSKLFVIKYQVHINQVPTSSMKCKVTSINDWSNRSTD